MAINPNGVAFRFAPGQSQPRWGWLGRDRSTQGSSQARNPGLCGAIPLGLSLDEDNACKEQRKPGFTLAFCAFAAGRPQSVARAAENADP